MKKLQVSIKLDMEVPEDWTLQDHPDGVPVLDIGNGRYMYMSFLPMFTEQIEPESQWTSECSESFSQEVLDMVEDEQVTMRFLTN